MCGKDGERMKNPDNELGPFEKGIDFILYFRGRRFELNDIKERYCCTYRQAIRLKSLAERLVPMVPDGSEGKRFYWRFAE